MSYICETCGKEYKTRSGLWKHQKKLKHGKFADSGKIIEGDGYSGLTDEPSKLNTSPETQSKPTRS